MIGQYLLKLLVALVDTPFVYAVVRLLERRRARPSVAPTEA
jgi:hypothetical protein